MLLTELFQGDGEGDLILGKYKRTALGTLVEHTTRFTMLIPLKAKDAQTVRKAYAKALTKLPSHLGLPPQGGPI